MNYEQRASELIAENESLKCQLNYMRKQVSMSSDYRDSPSELLAKTPEQCINSIKADAISEMFDRMPSQPFNKERDKNNWYADYIYDLRKANG